MTDLSPRERHALHAALGPDGLIDCPPGTDRPGFAVQVAAEAVRRGERVGIVTPDPDALLARVLDADLPAGRACGPDEPADPEHGFAAHTADADTRRRRIVEQLDRRRTEAAAAHAAAAALPRLHELADLLTKLSHEPKPEPVAAAKSGGLLGAVKGWFHKPEPAAPPPDSGHADRLKQQADALDQFRAAGKALAAAGLTVPTPAGLPAADTTVAKAVADADTAVATATDQLAAFDADRPKLVRELCRAVAVVVGPVAAFGDPLLAGVDRLIVVAADHLDDATLDGLSAPARVLLGSADGPARGYRNGKSGSFPRPTRFRRLWAERAAPEVWSADGPQLLATLRPHDPMGVREEPLADRPEVELRFNPAGDLVAVAFADTMTVAEARSLLACELGLVTLAGCGPHEWHDEPGRLTVCWPAVEAEGEWADLGDGVRELVSGCGPDALTAVVSFDRSQGWTRERAEAWLAERLPPAAAVRLPAPVLVAG